MCPSISLRRPRFRYVKPCRFGEMVLLLMLQQTTVNLKKVELPVKHIVSGRIVKPSGTLLNPESLDYYYQFAKVEDIVAPKSKL